MIRNPHILENLKNRLSKEEPPDFFRNAAIYDAMYEEACMLGVLPLKNPLAGKEEKIRFAKALNADTSYRKNGAGS